MSRSLTGDMMTKYPVTKYFIETGSYTGGGISAAKWRGFEQIISIEYDKVLYDACVRTFKNSDNITLLHGDSAEKLAKVLNGIDEMATIFLDAHSMTYNPILAELKAIKECGFKEHIIWIDDKREFVRKRWPEINLSNIWKHLYDINPNYIVRFEDSSNVKGDIITAWIR